MRFLVVLIAAGLLLLESGGIAKPSAATSYARTTTTVASPALVANSSPAPAASSTKERVDFDTQLKPIFQSKCMPCHFSGGKMYDRLPFDKPDTIRKLGTKLFTRIDDKNQRRLIEDFLSQSP